MDASEKVSKTIGKPYIEVESFSEDKLIKKAKKKNYPYIEKFVEAGMCLASSIIWLEMVLNKMSHTYFLTHETDYFPFVKAKELFFLGGAVLNENKIHNVACLQYNYDSIINKKKQLIIYIDQIMTICQEVLDDLKEVVRMRKVTDTCLNVKKYNRQIEDLYQKMRAMKFFEYQKALCKSTRDIVLAEFKYETLAFNESDSTKEVVNKINKLSEQLRDLSAKLELINLKSTLYGVVEFMKCEIYEPFSLYRPDLTEDLINSTDISKGNINDIEIKILKNPGFGWLFSMNTLGERSVGHTIAICGVAKNKFYWFDSNFGVYCGHKKDAFWQFIKNERHYDKYTAFSLICIKKK